MHMKFEIEIPKQTWVMLRKPCRLQTDRRTDGQGESSIPPSNFVGRGYKNAHEGLFPNSTTRARGRVPEMLYIFVWQSAYKSLLSNESESRVLKYSNILK